MKLAVVGSRTLKNYKLLLNELNQYDNITEIVSGGAQGADKLAERYAIEKNIPIKIFPANWSRWGKRAGYMRNREIWDYADEGIAFWDGHSRGTQHSFELSKFLGKKIKVIKFDISDNEKRTIIIHRGL
jgi:hypothetical protein